MKIDMKDDDGDGDEEEEALKRISEDKVYSYQSTHFLESSYRFPKKAR
jgi:hypothetical protein